MPVHIGCTLPEIILAASLPALEDIFLRPAARAGNILDVRDAPTCRTGAHEVWQVGELIAALTNVHLSVRHIGQLAHVHAQCLHALRSSDDLLDVGTNLAVWLHASWSNLRFAGKPFLNIV